MKEGEEVQSIFVSPSPSRAPALGGADPATKIVAPEVAQQLPVEPPADHQVRPVGLNLRERLSEQEREAFRRLMSSKEYRGVERQMNLFEARAEELKQKAAELVNRRSIPVDEESDVGLAINVLLEKKRGDLRFLSRAMKAIENVKSRFYKAFLPP